MNHGSPRLILRPRKWQNGLDLSGSFLLVRRNIQYKHKEGIERLKKVHEEKMITQKKSGTFLQTLGVVTVPSLPSGDLASPSQPEIRRGHNTV